MTFYPLDEISDIKIFEFVYCLKVCESFSAFWLKEKTEKIRFTSHTVWISPNGIGRSDLELDNMFQSRCLIDELFLPSLFHMMKQPAATIRKA